MRILVTGTSGFLGKAFLEILQKNEISDYFVFYTSKPVNGYSCVLYNQNHNNTISGNIDILLCIGGFVPKANEDHVDGYKHASAVLNMQALLQSLPNAPKRIVYCSSVEVYGRDEVDEVTEASSLNPYSLYSSQKLMCEGIVKEYAKKNNFQCLVLRLGPMFGKYDTRTNHFLPGIFYRALKGADITITVSPETKRNYIYVKDVARLLYSSLTSNAEGIINIVSKHNITLGEIVNTVVEVTNSNSCVISNSTIHCKQMIYDNQKMETYLGIELFSFFDGVKETVIWIEQQH